MKETVARQVIETMTSTKSGFIGIFIANVSVWWMDYGSALVAAATGICGLIYIILMTRIKWQEYRINKHQIQDIIAKEKANLNKIDSD